MRNMQNHCIVLASGQQVFRSPGAAPLMVLPSGSLWSCWMSYIWILWCFPAITSAVLFLNLILHYYRHGSVLHLKVGCLPNFQKPYRLPWGRQSLWKDSFSILSPQSMGHHNTGVTLALLVQWFLTRGARRKLLFAFIRTPCSGHVLQKLWLSRSGGRTWHRHVSEETQWVSSWPLDARSTCLGPREILPHL